MSQALAIAANTFKETVRDRILAVIVVFALLMIVASLWLASISLGEEGRVMTDFGLVAVSAFALVVAVFSAASLVRKEVEKRTVFVIFSKPVSRTAFIWGKFLGLAATLALVVAGMTVFLYLLVLVVTGDSNPWVLLAGGLIYLQVAVVVGATILFSTLTSAILASVLGLCVFIVGQLSHNVLSLTRLGASAVYEGLSWALFVVVPNFNAVDLKPVAVGESDADWALLGAWSVYLVAYLVVCLLLATWVFRRKEF